MRTRSCMTAAVIAIVGLFASSSASVRGETVEFEGKKWVAPPEVTATVEEYKGKQALHISGGREKSYTSLSAVEFGDGVIEVDLATGPFTGIGFRGNDKTHECVYFRPQNSGGEKHGNTVQYANHGNEKGTWRYLRTNYPGKYEAGADISQTDWIHAKLVISGANVKVYVNDVKKPVLVVEDLLQGNSRGTIGLWAYDGYFANFEFTPTAGGKTKP
jgi:hypothetical protein